MQNNRIEIKGPVTIEAKEIVDEDFYDIIVDSYMSYASYVIMTRAIPGLDGCKIVQLRSLYNMFVENNTFDNRFRKCARIIGEVSGKYHPHGELSIYEAIVRMAQPFNSYVPLIESQGNFGSADGDSPAAARYTEARLSQVGTYVLGDLAYKGVVDMRKNYDSSLEEPVKIPIRAPMLIVNGAYGIAVGFTTLIPSHMPSEIVNIIKYFIANYNNRRWITYNEIKHLFTGPDFKIFSIIDNSFLDQIYTTGQGPLLTSCQLDFNSTDNSIDIVGLPFNVKKSRLIESIAEAIQNKIITNVVDLIDYTKDEYYHLKLLLDSEANANLLIKRLKKYTLCSNTVGCNFRVIVDQAPKILSLVEIINYFIDDRIQIIRNRLLSETRDSLSSIEKILALFIAVSTDKTLEVISSVLESKNLADAREALANMKFNIVHISHLLPQRLKKLDLANFALTAMQIEYLLSMTIKRLNKEKISELKNSMLKHSQDINAREEILANEIMIYEIIINELDQFIKLSASVTNNHKRYCRLEKLSMNIHRYALEEEVSLFLAVTTKREFIWKELGVIKTQKRGGKGRTLNSNIVASCCCTSHDDLFIITDLGRIFSVEVFNNYYNDISLKDSINLGQEMPVYIFSKRTIGDYKYILILTHNGLIKKHTIDSIKFVNKSGKFVCNLDEGDKIKKVLFANDGDFVSIFTRQCRSITLDVNSLGILSNVRTRGCKGIKLKEGDSLVDAVAFNQDTAYLIIISATGYAKKVSFSDVNIANRNTMGTKYLSSKYGQIISAISILDDTKILISTTKGNLIVLETDSIPVLNKYAKGVKILDLSDNDNICNAIVL